MRPISEWSDDQLREYDECADAPWVARKLAAEVLRLRDEVGTTAEDSYERGWDAAHRQNWSRMNATEAALTRVQEGLCDKRAKQFCCCLDVECAIEGER
jgi:hypothetical protein